LLGQRHAPSPLLLEFLLELVQFLFLLLDCLARRGDDCRGGPGDGFRRTRAEEPASPWLCAGHVLLLLSQLLISLLLSLLFLLLNFLVFQPTPFLKRDGHLAAGHGSRRGCSDFKEVARTRRRRRGTACGSAGGPTALLLLVFLVFLLLLP